jgi:hypothetical protein
MKHYRFVRLFRSLTPCGVLTLALLALLPAIASHPAQAQTETVLYSFCPLPGTCPDGASPLSRLIADGAGNLYGTATNGGAESIRHMELSLSFLLAAAEAVPRL